jgi:preprotein translocase subunit SecG
MYEFILTIHVVVCLLLVLVVLMQSGKGAGLNMFGGGGDTLFSAPSGSSFMRQFTTGLAIAFGLTSLFLTLSVSRSEMRSVTNRVAPPPPQQSEPQTPGQPQAGSKQPIQPVKPGQGAANPAPAVPKSK